MIARANADFAKRIFGDRLGNDYVYAGEWSPNNSRQGCDCSALVAHICNAAIYGSGMQWRRIDPATGGWITTESWRPIEVGQRGPFGTITVASPRDFPADAAVKIALHHGPGGGANSHMNCMVEGIYMESSGSHGCCSNNSGAIPHSSTYWNDFAYLPGPISGDGVIQPPPDEHVTIFGPDISNHQANIDIAQIKREGFEFLFAKVSEGAGYKDPYWPRNRDAAREQGLILAGYHYVRTDDPYRQADTFVSHLGDKSIPAMLDFELNSGGISNFWAVKNAIESRGVRVALSYIPKWYWRDHIGAPDLSGVPGLIQSSYVNGTGYASNLYPGDDSARWAPYGNRQPILLQFTDKAQVAGQFVDANAFRGTPDQLRELLGQGNWVPVLNQLVGGNNPMATADDVNRQMDDPNDKVMIYEGSAFQHLGWTIRDWTRTLAWDLTRFQKPGEARFKANPAGVWGLRDAVSSIQRQLNDNNKLLKKLCDKQGITYTDVD